MVENDATTIWEFWNGNTADPAMNSGNHVMLVGDLVIWLNECVAGIQSDPAQPGFKHILMRAPPRRRSDVGQSVSQKPVRPHQERMGNQELHIPLECLDSAGNIRNPLGTGSRRSRSEGIRQADREAKGIKVVGRDRDAVELEIGSGDVSIRGNDRQGHSPLFQTGPPAPR